MTIICNAFKANTTVRCSQGISSGCTIEHEGHTHHVCRNHFNNKDKAWFTIDPSTCPKQETKQEALPMTNTDGIAHVQEAKVVLNTQQTREQAHARILDRITDTSEDIVFGEFTEDGDFTTTEEDNMIRIMVTGHTRLANEAHIEKNLSGLIEMYINTYGKERIMVVSGGALGTDKLFARAAYKLDVPFEVYVPTGYEHVFIALNRYNSKDQAARNKDMENFYSMLDKASAVFNEKGEPRDPNGRYIKGANFVRNTTMVQVSQHHIAVSNHDPKEVIRNTRLNSGTYHAIREMKRLGVEEMIYIPTQVTEILFHKIVRL